MAVTIPGRGPTGLELDSMNHTFARLMRVGRKTKTATLPCTYLRPKPLGSMARANFGIRGDCSVCLRTDVPCLRLGSAGTVLACAECTMTGRI